MNGLRIGAGSNPGSPTFRNSDKNHEPALGHRRALARHGPAHRPAPAGEPGCFGQSAQCFDEMDDIVRRQRAPGLCRVARYSGRPDIGSIRRAGGCRRKVNAPAPIESLLRDPHPGRAHGHLDVISA